MAPSFSGHGVVVMLADLQSKQTLVLCIINSVRYCYLIAEDVKVLINC